MGSDVLLHGRSWEEMADGQLWRLKRGSHFTGELRSAQEAANSAARALGKVVRTIRDELGANQYLWVQFADRSVPLNEPCPVCGAAVLVRLHSDFARCSSCDSLLMLTPARTPAEPQPQPQPQPQPPITVASDISPQKNQAPDARRRYMTLIKEARLSRPKLAEYPHVELACYERNKDLERYRGWAIHPSGEYVLLLVDYALENGKRVPSPDDPTQEIHSVMQWEIAPYGDAIDLDRLSGDGLDPDGS